MNGVSRNKILRVSTVAFFVDTQLHSQINMMVDAGFDVSIVASDKELKRPIKNSKYYSIDIPREINLVKDFLALVKLCILFRKNKYNVVHSTTPKAGLLCALAGKLTGVPIRVHTFTGQPWVTLTGLKKFLAKFSDKIIGYCSTVCYTDSHSQKEFLVKEKIITEDKLKVLGLGSIAGVDLKRFNCNAYNATSRETLKSKLGIPKYAFVFVFVGRITKDKGVFELVEAFKIAFNKNNNLFLLMVGPQELNLDDLGIDVNSLVGRNIIFTGYTDTPEEYLSISKALCIPSYREGFGTVVIEAAAMGLPAIGTNIYGLSDAVVDGETGILVEKKNVSELSFAIERLSGDTALLHRLSSNAYARAIEHYSDETVNGLVIGEYSRLLSK